MRLSKLALTSWTLLLSAVTFAQSDVTIDFTSQGYANAEEVTSLTQDGVTVTFDKGTSNNIPKYYTSGTAVRLYGGNTMKLESESKITAVAFTFGSGEGTNAITADQGTYDEGTWSGEANDVTFTIGGTSGHRRIQRLVVTLAGGDTPAPAVAKPTFTVTPESSDGYGPVSVTIETATEGASIYYTVDGTNPTTESNLYEYPVIVSMTGVVVKAIAVKGNSQSAVAAQPVAINPIVYNIPGLVAFADGTQFKYVSQLTIVAMPSTKYMFVTDGYSGMTTLLYDGSGEKFAAFQGEDAAGKHVAADWTGKVSFYNKLFEVVPDKALAVGYGSGSVSYPVKDLDYVTADNVNQVVMLRGVSYTLGSGKNLTITKGDATVAGYNQFGIEIGAPEDGKTYDIIGAVGRFNDNIQFQPISISEALNTIEVPETADVQDWTLEGSFQQGFGGAEAQYATKVAFDGSDIYIKGLAYDLKETDEDWVKGTVSGNVVTIPSGQLIGFDEYGNKYYLLGSDDFVYYQGGTVTDIVFDYDAEAKTLKAQTKYIINNYNQGDAINSQYISWFEDVEMYAGTPVTVDPVSAPENLVTDAWRIKATQEFSWGGSEEITGKLQVGLDGDDLYVQGFVPNTPLWFKATKNAEGQYVVPSMQYMGKGGSIWTPYNCYFTAVSEDGTPVDVVFDYDTDAQVLSSSQTLVISDAKKRISSRQTFVGTTTISAIPEVVIDELPYEPAFDVEDEDAFKFINANNDESTWMFLYNTARYYYDFDNAADDWIVTPKVKLEAGKTYSISFDLWAQSEDYIERLEVKLATEATVEALTAGSAIIGPIEFNNTVAKTVSNDNITVDEDGYYFFGIHAISDANTCGIAMENLKIDEVGGTVGISTVADGSDRSSTEVYNMNGQRVGVAGKGLYIVNGKKFVVK